MRHLAFRVADGGLRQCFISCRSGLDYVKIVSSPDVTVTDVQHTLTRTTRFVSQILTTAY